MTKQKYPYKVVISYDNKDKIIVAKKVKKRFFVKWYKETAKTTTS